MAIRVTLECGHASTLRMRTTREGYTHDWQVFVRGVDNADIHHYIEKVVFILHETFPKPKRVLKEPPFLVKESGYAGFVIPIHIYLKNKDEPKKLQILYDLHLQTSGPAINNVIRHTEIINNPSDEFRRKLLKGGAVVVSSSEGSAEKSESKTPTMVGKPKLSGSETKKHKVVESKTSNSFAELFGTPLKPTKVSQEIKKPTQPEKSSAPKPVVTAEKSDKTEKTKIKDSPHKEGKKDKVDEKKDKKVRDLSKDKNRSKDKSKRPSSPGGKSHSSPASKRPSSPVSLKRPPSPSLPPVKRPASPKPKEKEVKKVVPEKEKEKDKEKVKDTSKSALDSSKSEKRKDKKKHKEDRDKDRKEKYKDGERSTLKEVPKLAEKKSDKPEKSEKSEKEKIVQEYKSKEGRKSPKPPKELEKPKEEKPMKLDKSEKTDKTDKTKDGKSDKDRQKHKHKKRDKKDKRDSSKEREKKEKRDRIKVSTEKQTNIPNVPISNPLSTLLSEMPERDSSDSAPSVDDDSFSESKVLVKKEIENTLIPTVPEMAKPLSPGIPDIKKEKIERKREKPKGSRGEERESRKRKRRSESKGDEERSIKREKDRGLSTSPPLEPVSSSQSPVVDQEMHIKVEEERSTEQAEKGNEIDTEQVAPDSTNSTLIDSDVGEPSVFSEDYVSQLKDLQQKIMTLQDNDELYRVVQVIAEGGQFEITRKTLDFDLCSLNRRTVQRLQEFFPAS